MSPRRLAWLAVVAIAAAAAGWLAMAGGAEPRAALGITLAVALAGVTLSP